MAGSESEVAVAVKRDRGVSVSELYSKLVVFLRSHGCDVSEWHHNHVREKSESILGEIGEGE